MLISALVLFFSSATVASAIKKLKLFNEDKKKYEVVTVIEYQGLTLSSTCQKNGKMNCDAWKAVQKKVARQETANVGVVGNPAARYCLAQNSLNRILKDQQGREYDYCVFPDGSAIDSWSLFNKHFAEKK
ncbi:hypothetical protein Bdt_0078 [Bdellovibrio bacteriovorus str. Tiberius]|uniref:DUF333 domain-containing protein n=1 Tax=Bdellovibrio bacteriovorus str. Tiberius TaxID=1069642 RepID=K7YJF5_BDEBC|nr:hypothetical protein Bdt_0078 [Bdellovibrio bacteriovorus str. Tiberius]